MTQHQKGFTLVEVIVVVGIVGLLSSFLSSQFGRSRVDFDQAVNAVIANVRQAQLWASSGRLHSSAYRCGYGIHVVSGTQYMIYAGPIATANCSTDNRNYDGVARDTVVTTFSLTNSPFFIATPFAPDIFFEPPNPVTYINNQSTTSTPPARIIVNKTGANCNTNPLQCRAICVYRSGKIQVAPTWTACP
mgnify:CR=1 FL=1